MKIVSVVGPSGSGKTTLIKRLIAEFKGRGLNVAAVKHCHREVPLDREGKDTWMYSEAGAAWSCVVTPRKKAVFDTLGIPGDPKCFFSGLFFDADIVLVEGGKTMKGLKKISIVRQGAEEAVSVPDEELLALVRDGETPAPHPDKPLSQSKDASAVHASAKRLLRPGNAGSSSHKKPVFHPGSIPEIADFILAEGTEVPEVTMEVDGESIPLDPIGESFIRSAALGAIGSLKGAPVDPETAVIRLRRGRN